MHQRIATADAELGMFIVRLEGNWFRHPFWKRRFILSEESDLAALRDSGVDGLVIDLERGKGVAKSQPDATKSLAVRPIEPAQPIPAATRWDAQSAKVPPLPEAKEFGAARKVVDRAEKIISQVFLKARLGEAVTLADVEPVVDDIYQSVTRNEYALSGLLRCREGKGEIYRHALAMCALMVALARSMKLSASEVREAGLAGLMCDIGVGQMTQALEGVGGDYRALPDPAAAQHVFFGHDLLATVPDTPVSVLRACLDHHERLDGSGYPQRLMGEEIDQMARMVAVCDEFDYLVSGGFQQLPIEPAEAVAQLQRRAAEFDQDIVSAFVESVGVYPIGTFLELESGRIAMVVSVNPFDTGHPTVRAFYSRPRNAKIRPLTIDLASTYGQERIVGVADIAGLELPDPMYLRAHLLTNAYRH